MQKNKIHPTIELIVGLLYRFKIWQADESESRAIKRKFAYLIFYITFPIYDFACVFLVDDESESFFLAVTGVMITVNVVRVIYVLWKSEEILAFLYHPINDNSADYLEETEESNRTMGNFMKFTHTYIATLSTAAIAILILSMPMLTHERMLPLFVKFSYDGICSGILYYFVYAYVAVEDLISLLFNITNVLIWYILLNYSIAYEELGNQQKKLGSCKEICERNSAVTSSGSYHEDLVSSIEVHKDIFR